MCKIQVARKVYEMEAWPFLHDYVEQWDLSLLHSLSIKESTKNRYMPGVWGNRRHRVIAGVFDDSYGMRISCLFKGEDKDFPGDPNIYKPKKWGKYGGIARRETVYDNLQDLIIYIVGHEMWHFLAHTGQIQGDPRNEYMAYEAGDELVTAWKR